MDKSNDSATSIQFWKVIEAKAKLAINTIAAADCSSTNSSVLHLDFVKELWSQLEQEYRRNPQFPHGRGYEIGRILFERISTRVKGQHQEDQEA